MPLDQHIESGHRERQARLKIRPAPMHHLPFKRLVLRVLERIFSFSPSRSASPRTLIQHSNFCLCAAWLLIEIRYAGYSRLFPHWCKALLSAKFERLDDLESRFQADLDNICETFNVERLDLIT